MKKTPFQTTHAPEFGLEVVSKDAKGDVTVQCLFCVYEGRDAVEVGGSSGRKRKACTTIKYFTKPFAPLNYRSHLKQHAESWDAYQNMSEKDKKEYFKGKMKCINTLHQHIDLTADSIDYFILADIVETIIGDLFFRDDEQLNDDNSDDNDTGAAEAIAKKFANRSKKKVNAMKLFFKQPDESCKVTIKNVSRFELAMDHFAIGTSFLQTARAIQHAKDHTKTAKWAGINDQIVGRHVRVMVAVALQEISYIIDDESVWSISLAGDSSTHRGQYFFDLRLRICFSGVLINLHPVAIPMFERHTTENMFNMVVKFLDALYGRWRDKLVGVSSDGENTMTGRHSGFVTRMVRCATNKVLRIWCPAHQIDIVVKASSEGIFEGSWIKVAYKWSVLLRAQDNLIISMNVKCPKKTNRWVHLGRLLNFSKQYRRQLISYTNEKRPHEAPSSD